MTIFNKLASILTTKVSNFFSDYKNGTYPLEDAISMLDDIHTDDILKIIPAEMWNVDPTEGKTVKIDIECKTTMESLLPEDLDNELKELMKNCQITRTVE